MFEEALATYMKIINDDTNILICLTKLKMVQALAEDGQTDRAERYLQDSTDGIKHLKDMGQREIFTAYSKEVQAEFALG